jgi:FAD/FMN-containing dehydrogenase
MVRDSSSVHKESVKELEVDSHSQPIHNFGQNVHFTPERYYVPHNEEQIIQILNRHSEDHIRAVGSLHSWSDITSNDEVVIDLRHFDDVSIEKQDDKAWVTAGAGCKIKEVNKKLYQEEGLRLPAQPVITAPTLGGAIATGTHGTGTPSLSHFVEKIRIAAYNKDTGEARIYEFQDGPELKAARCNLGCMGIVLSIRIRCISEFLVEERVVERQNIQEVLAEKEDYPLQEFLYVPYSWTFVNFQRREVAESVSGDSGKRSWGAPLYNAYNFLNVDLIFSLIVKGLNSFLGKPERTRFFFKNMFPKAILKKVTVRERSHQLLTRKREIFSHEEEEIFIPEDHIAEAVELIRLITEVFAGIKEHIPEKFSSKLESVGVLEKLKKSRGTYTHHFPFVFLRLLPDHTFISMSGGMDKPCYGFNLVTYQKPGDREDFHQFADVITFALARLYNARPHWGKYFSLEQDDIETLYPDLENFREVCRQYDPKGVFQNNFTRQVLGFEIERY